MKIVHFVSSLQIGGAERFVIDLCQIQQKEGLKVKILNLGQSDDPLVSVCQAQDIPVETITKSSRLLKLLKNLFSTDVIHIHSPHVLKSLLLYLFLFFYKRIIYTRHGERLTNPNWKTIHRLANWTIDHVTFVSTAGLEKFKSGGYLKHTAHHVIENGVDTDIKINNYIRLPEKVRFASVGRMATLKNQISLLKALQHINSSLKSHIEVHFFGDGECEPFLRKYTNENLDIEQVIFHGVETDRNKIYESFDVLIVTSETEGLSLAIIEAMNFNHPVIASRVGGNPRLVIHEQTGFLFEYNDVETLVTLMQSFIEKPELIDIFGNQAKKHIVSHFSLQKTHKEYLKLYL